MNRLLRCVAWTLTGMVAIPSLASAQVYPVRPSVVRPPYPQPYPVPNPYPNPYMPVYSPGTGYGNMLSGAADLNRANSEYLVTYEQTRIMREQSNQAKIDTRKKSFDQMLYEKANTPTYGEELSKEKMQLLTRLMNHPIRSEISDGKTLNVMLPYLQSLTTQGAQGSPIPIPPQHLYALNVSGTTSGGGSVGMLRNGGQVDWPPGLRGPQQKNLDQLLPAAFQATVSGQLDAKMLKRIRAEMKTMRETLRVQLNREEIETSSYFQAIQFYNSLESAVNALERPDARKQLDGSYSARGRNVQELVEHMTENGLRFAPGSPGSENAYQAVHDAFVRYARIAQSSSGFQASRNLNAPVSNQKN